MLPSGGGLGELKIKHSEETEKFLSSAEEGSLDYSSPSITALALKVCSEGYDEIKARKLLRPSRPLLDLLDELLRAEGLASKVRKLFPVRDFNYRTYRALDDAVYRQRETTGGML